MLNAVEQKISWVPKDLVPGTVNEIYDQVWMSKESEEKDGIF